MINTAQVGQLTLLEIDHPHFFAQVLLQGAQLIHFAPKKQGRTTQNWLWLSTLAQYKQGVAVRGGIPICWPVFGAFERNPDAVKETFKTEHARMAQHGSARKQLFTVVDNQVCSETATLTLAYTEVSHNLKLMAHFHFGHSGFEITLTTKNLSKTSCTFSQALHTYFPTTDIAQTQVTGFNGAVYTDTLQSWQTHTQTGAILFSNEVDRIYHKSPTMHVITPNHMYRISTRGSCSTVVWNPWAKKAKSLSQFADLDYQRMLCVEVANAHHDVVQLKSGESHSLAAQVSMPLNS